MILTIHIFKYIKCWVCHFKRYLAFLLLLRRYNGSPNDISCFYSRCIPFMRMFGVSQSLYYIIDLIVAYYNVQYTIYCYIISCNTQYLLSTTWKVSKYACIRCIRGMFFANPRLDLAWPSTPINNRQKYAMSDRCFAVIQG